MLLEPAAVDRKLEACTICRRTAGSRSPMTTLSDTASRCDLSSPPGGRGARLCGDHRARRSGRPEYRKATKFGITYRHADGVRGDGSHEWMKIPEDRAPLIAAAARSTKPPKKQFQRSGKRRMSVRKPDRKAGFYSPETMTTHSPETMIGEHKSQYRLTPACGGSLSLVTNR